MRNQAYSEAAKVEAYNLFSRAYNEELRESFLRSSLTRYYRETRLSDLCRDLALAQQRNADRSGIHLFFYTDCRRRTAAFRRTLGNVFTVESAIASFKRNLLHKLLMSTSDAVFEHRIVTFNDAFPDELSLTLEKLMRLHSTLQPALLECGALIGCNMKPDSTNQKKMLTRILEIALIPSQPEPESEKGYKINIELNNVDGETIFAKLIVDRSQTTIGIETCFILCCTDKKKERGNNFTAYEAYVIKVIPGPDSIDVRHHSAVELRPNFMTSSRFLQYSSAQRNPMALSFKDTMRELIVKTRQLKHIMPGIDGDKPLIVGPQACFCISYKLYVFCFERFEYDLLHYIENEKTSLSDVINIARQLISLISVAHEKNMVIRDLKPQNLLLTADLHVALTDLNEIIQSSDPPCIPLRGDTKVFGTPLYWPYEMGLWVNALPSDHQRYLRMLKYRESVNQTRVEVNTDLENMFRNGYFPKCRVSSYNAELHDRGVDLKSLPADSGEVAPELPVPMHDTGIKLGEAQLFLTHKSDVYSLAVTLFQLVINEKVLNSIQHKTDMIFVERFALLVLAMLEIEPDDRPSMETVMQCFRKLLKDTGHEPKNGAAAADGNGGGEARFFAHSKASLEKHEVTTYLASSSSEYK